jgi:hypothetical protein
MSTNGTIKVKYILDKPNGDFQKGIIYDVRRPKCSNAEKWLAYTDKHGDHYAYPSSWFEIIEAKNASS